MLKYGDLAFHSPKLRARMIPGWELDYFNSEEWLNVQDRLDERDKEKLAYTPARADLFRALSLCSWRDCNVAFLGQDPYPNPSHASGLAFSVREGSLTHSYMDTRPTNPKKPVPKAILRVPPSLFNIFRELVTDLQVPWPKDGNLEPWCKQGVLLWNVMPIHRPLADFGPLTQEIVERLSAKGKVVFVFCGRKAQEYEQYVDLYNNRVIRVSHPSPRGQISARSRFVGSRVFSTINSHLNYYLKETIDWTL